MALTNETLLPQTIFGIPSGNYNGTDTTFFGNAVPAANYYGGLGSDQTAFITVSNFIGNITLQATLNDWTQQAIWFDVDSYGDIANATSDTTSINMLGNFVWIRAKVEDFTGGVINSATVVF